MALCRLRSVSSIQINYTRLSRGMSHWKRVGVSDAPLARKSLTAETAGCHTLLSPNRNHL